MKLRTLNTLSYVMVMGWISNAYPIPQKVTLKNMTDATQKVWINSNYTVEKASPFTRKEKTVRVVREIPPRSNFTYGTRNHTFQKLDVRFGPEIAGVAVPTNSVVVAGLNGVKSVITITSATTYKVDNKERFSTKAKKAAERTKEQVTEAKDAFVQGVRNTAEDAKEKGAVVVAKVKEKAHEARDTAADYADRAKVKVARAKEEASSGWARMKCRMYLGWCNFKARVHNFFHHQPII